MESVTIKIDKKIKKAAEKQANKQGIPLARFVASVFTSSLKNKNSYFNPDGELNDKTRKILTKEMKEIRRGKNMSPIFLDLEDAVNYLKKS